MKYATLHHRSCLLLLRRGAPSRDSGLQNLVGRHARLGVVRVVKADAHVKGSNASQRCSRCP
eukprot:8848156-Pyramimonas_sp.AAC.1